MCRTPFQSASRPASSSVDEGSSLTPQRRPTSTHHEQVSQRCSDHRTNDTRSTAASVTETVSVQITLPATRSNFVVYTACVELSEDSTRRESHAAGRLSTTPDTKRREELSINYKNCAMRRANQFGACILHAQNICKTKI